jgi:site-specific recombinase XerD
MPNLEELGELFLAHHQALGRSAATVTHYQDSLKLLARCFKELDILPLSTNLSNHHMNLFATWLRETPTKLWRGKTERSIYGVHGALKDTKAFVRWLAEEELIDKPPKVPVPTLPQTLFPVLTDAQLDTIFRCAHVAAGTEIAIRNRALVAFMLDTGVRLSEAASLTVANLNLADGSAKIRGKGAKERMVYFSAGASEALTKWLAIRGDEAGQVFWLQPSGIRMLFKRIKDETGLTLLTAHQVRHTAFTMLVKQNVDLHTIKRIAGHASVTTTEAYLALSGDEVKDKHAAASPFDLVNRRVNPAPTGRRRLKSG